jgi:hypothetical protein
MIFNPFSLVSSPAGDFKIQQMVLGFDLMGRSTQGGLVVDSPNNAPSRTARGTHVGHVWLRQ